MSIVNFQFNFCLNSQPRITTFYALLRFRNYLETRFVTENYVNWNETVFKHTNSIKNLKSSKYMFLVNLLKDNRKKNLIEKNRKR